MEDLFNMANEELVNTKVKAGASLRLSRFGLRQLLRVIALGILRICTYPIEEHLKYIVAPGVPRHH